MNFSLKTDYSPAGDQVKAIEELSSWISGGVKYATLLGVTGSGKTFTMANVIKKLNRPTIVISPNKTLAAQLYGEFKTLFPENAVEYFISYYDYYQPEAYIPQSDTYIEKDASINEEIDRLRLKAMVSLLTRRDVIVVASVSCIYGLGSPVDFTDKIFNISVGDEIDLRFLAEYLIDIYYVRNDIEFKRGTFRVRGDIIEIFPAYERNAFRIEFFGNEIDRITIIDPLTGETLQNTNSIGLYPAKQFVTSHDRVLSVIPLIEKELKGRIKFFEDNDMPLEAERIRSRTRYDLAMLKEVGYCSGIENYSRYLSGRKEGERPYTILDYFPDDYLMFIDESHITVPQIRGMYNGDHSRKKTLVDFGFRLPSCLDNRPLHFDEFEGIVNQVIYVSATPREYELNKSGKYVSEQIIRPTGLVDPIVEVREKRGMIEDVLKEINIRAKREERVLITTLTKKMAEDLTDFLLENGVRARYLHSSIQSMQRVEIIRDLRLGDFDVLVGINLLREGLDLPEVSLVIILDADKSGFLRSERTLIQIIGRTARHKTGKVIMYADDISPDMENAIRETERRRKIQLDFNKKHGIVPESIVKSVDEIMMITQIAGVGVKEEKEAYHTENTEKMSRIEKMEYLRDLKKKMDKAVEELNFELAAKIRDEIFKIRKEMIKHEV
ncbi:excinuclease ABC subunit UvrB [candidate division WOR-3 bacterium]|nr:excinuclease ABC subunit UvrB [candidate division WOR-3 bacterium]